MIERGSAANVDKSTAKDLPAPVMAKVQTSPMVAEMKQNPTAIQDKLPAMLETFGASPRLIGIPIQQLRVRTPAGSVVMTFVFSISHSCPRIHHAMKLARK